MKCLLDTNVFIWWFNADKRLPVKFKEVIDDDKNIKYVSVACFWEIVIKMKTGKLRLKKTLKYVINHLDDFIVLNIKLDHVMALGHLPNIHKDPFDRIIISQAKVEDLILLTSDRKIKRYFEN